MRIHVVLASVAVAMSFIPSALAEPPAPGSSVIKRRPPPPAIAAPSQATLDAVINPVRARRVRGGPGSDGPPPTTFKSFDVDPLHPIVQLKDDAGRDLGFASVDVWNAEYVSVHPTAVPPSGEWAIWDPPAPPPPGSGFWIATPTGLALTFPVSKGMTYVISCKITSATSVMSVQLGGRDDAPANVDAKNMLFAFNADKSGSQFAYVHAKKSFASSGCTVKSVS